MDSNLQHHQSEIESSNEGVSKKLLNELFNPSLDLSVDYSDIYIDDIIENEGIKQIPIVKSVVGLVKGGIAINQFWFAKKLLVFIQTFNDGTISHKKLEDFKAKLNSEEKFGKKIAEQLMVHIDRNIEISKTKVISNLFKSYVNEDLSYEAFSEILITLNDLNPKAFNAFIELEKIDFQITSENHKQIGPRNFENESLITTSGFATEPSPWFSRFKLTNNGELLFKFGIKPMIK